VAKFYHGHILLDFLKLNLETDNLFRNHAFLLKINEYKICFHKNEIRFLNAAQNLYFTELVKGSKFNHGDFMQFSKLNLKTDKLF